MTDNRSIATIVDEARSEALNARLRVVDTALAKDLKGVSVITARDIFEVFAQPVDGLERPHAFEATTPASGIVDLVCLHCDQPIKDVAVALGAVTTTDKPGISKVRLKATANVRNHVCGQQPLPEPRPPEVEGQVGMDDEAEQSDAAAIERIEGVFDDDLLPGEDGA